MPEANRRQGDRASAASGLEELYGLVEDIAVAVLTTRRRDGSLVSRPMAMQRRMPGAHFWFVAAEGHGEIDEISADPNVNLAFSRERTKEWVSVAGVARVVRDRAKIRELYEPGWKVWFPTEDELRNGGPDDPRMVLLAVGVRSARSVAVHKRAEVMLFEYFKGWTEQESPQPDGVERVAGADWD